MRLEEVTAEIRPRSDWEAVDLGFAMVRRDFWRCFTVWWLALLLPLLVAGWLLRDYPLWVATLFWWWKPAGSRMVLFELSRRLFGEKPAWKAVVRELPRAWGRRFFYRFLWARLSPWLPVALAVEDLEGLRGNAYRQRAGQLARRGNGVVMWIYFMGGAAVLWVGMSLFAVAVMLLPQGQSGAWRMAWESWDTAHMADVPPLIGWTFALCAMLAMALADLFVIGAGFGIYVNNRTWLEGWDVELAFRRLGQRLGKLVALLLLVLVLFLPAASQAREKTDAEVMAEVKTDADFKVHSVTRKVLKEEDHEEVKRASPVSSSGGSSSGSYGSGLAGLVRALQLVFAVAACGLLLGLLGWLLWKYRHSLFIRGGRRGEKTAPEAARVVMGMEVSAAALPKDIPTKAWALWQQGRRHEALGLLYRGTISKVIDISRVEIQESDTEGDCLRRVETAGAGAYPEYFRGLTASWMRLAYAGEEPPEREVEALCREWPFLERRRA